VEIEMKLKQGQLWIGALEPWEGFFSLGFGFTLRCEIFALGIQFATENYTNTLGLADDILS
jgi:hypothetical protein